ncbi:MAG: metal-dependent transcriptional regulator [Oscillospiraceae bacterium]|nr:metal-dependent transcriptional regulator [Oscillospiraceae bacterium]
MLTYSQKKYLFAIYKLSLNGGEVRSADVAASVGVSKPSTVKMMQSLSDDGYILKEHYGKISLTPTGVKEAEELFKRCSILGDFLSNTAGVNEENADTDAVTIVSQVSDETIEKLVGYIQAEKTSLNP